MLMERRNFTLTFRRDQLSFNFPNFLITYSVVLIFSIKNGSTKRRPMDEEKLKGRAPTFPKTQLALDFNYKMSQLNGVGVA